MADFSLQDLWWLKPKEPDNPLPAMQLGAQMVQNRAKIDLAERDLANDIARTSLMRQEMLYKQEIQTQLSAGNTAIAGAIAGVDDWTDDEQVSKVWATGAQYPFTVGGKAWLGAQHAHESARTAKRLEEEAKSRIEAREDRSEYNANQLELRRLLADSTIELNDERIVGLQRRNAMIDREMAVKEGNVRLRERDITNKEKRLADTGRWSAEDKIEFQSRSKAALSTITDANEADLAIQEIREDIEAKRQQRLPKAQREGLKTAPPPETAPQPISPSNDAKAEEIRATFRASKKTEEDKKRALQQLRELGFK